MRKLKSIRCGAQQQRVESAARAQQQPEAVDVPVPRQRRLGAALPVPTQQLDV